MKIHTERSIDPVTEIEIETHFVEYDDGTREPISRVVEATHLSWSIIAKLHAAGIKSPEEARATADEDLLDIPGIGKVAIREIREVLG